MFGLSKFGVKVSENDGTMTLVNLHDNVRSVREDTGFTSILNIA